MAASRRSSISSRQVDLTAVPLDELACLRSPELSSAVLGMLASARRRGLAESVQEQRWVAPEA